MRRTNSIPTQTGNLNHELFVGVQTLPRARFGRSDHPPWPCRPCEKALMAATTLSIAPGHAIPRRAAALRLPDWTDIRVPGAPRVRLVALRTLNPAKRCGGLLMRSICCERLPTSVRAKSHRKALRLATHEVNENVGDIVLALFHLDPRQSRPRGFRGSPSQPIRHPMGGPKPYRPSPRARCSAGRSRRGWK